MNFMIKKRNRQYVFFLFQKYGKLKKLKKLRKRMTYQIEQVLEYLVYPMDMVLRASVIRQTLLCSIFSKEKAIHPSKTI